PILAPRTSRSRCSRPRLDHLQVDRDERAGRLSLRSTDPATPQLYTLSLHDALPISLLVADTGSTNGTFINGRRISYGEARQIVEDRKSTRLNSSHVAISYAVFCLKKKTPSRVLCTPRPHPQHPLKTLVRPRPMSKIG